MGGLRILYAAALSPNDSSEYRRLALERLGHETLPLNAFDYQPGSPWMRRVLHRVQAGPWVERLNRDILRLAERQRPEVFWADKLLGLRAQTVEQLRARGVASISYMIDNAFGPRRDPGWRLYRGTIPSFDLHVVQRDANLEDYRRAGARDVLKIQTAFEPTIHYPPPAGWSDRERDRGVSFIGTPYDDRASFLTRLALEFGLPVTVSGGLVWRRALADVGGATLYRGHGELFREAYREGIWRSEINLSFLTHSNGDEFVHKSFEIAACGGFLLAERSAGHRERFAEDQEAVFFSSIEECAAKIRRYLPDETARARIAAAGQRRAVASGYDNDTQMGQIVERLRTILGALR